MKTEIAEKWVAELRSGKYSQGRERLHKKDFFCCLGVLCEMAVKEKICDSIIPDREIGETMYDKDVSVLPLSVKKWAGMVDVCGLYKDGSGEHLLTTQNDNGKTFSEIADIIEKNWESL